MNGSEFRLANEKCLGNDICANSFYISFTDDNLDIKQEDYMWNEFADKGTGVRLVFGLCNDSKLDLRKMYYPPNNSNTSI
ncbi:MAG: hypothetical protein LBL57_07420 [Tannerella sp.]|jgi:hypothetical protein|nr:hypothetical protein [Tannerella sp.]